MSSTAVLTPSALYTPMRFNRRKRLSISPKKHRPKPCMSDLYPVPSSTHKEDTESYEDKNIDLPLGFSFWDDENRCFKPITTAERQKLSQELCTRYPQVEAITISIPFVIIECRESIPPVDQQVFMAAGLVCVYIVEGGTLPFGSEYIGYYGEGEMPSDVPEHVSRDIRPFHIPKLSTFEYIHKMIPDATHVSSYPMQLVIELDAMSPKDFEKKLMSLPSGIGRLSIGYVNGKLLVHPSQALLKAPDPTHLEGDCDDTDYLSPENGGSLRPGVLLESKGIMLDDGTNDGIMQTNTGVKVCRQGQVRFTCAKHGWDKPSIDNAVYHGNRNVGTITEIYGEDVGLVTTQYSFSNELLDLNIHAKRLLHSSLIPFGEFAVIDSAYTSRQRMRLFGVRTGKKRAPENYVGPQTPYEYVTVDQGIFSVQAAAINREPRIRDGVCGTPIIHQGMALSDQSALEHGEVLGFMHYTDVVGFNNDSRLYSYGQVVDPLIEDGWEICAE
jgi:hypothetical protein